MPPGGDQPPARGNFAVEAPDGYLRDNPEGAIRALSRMAATEGADEDDWLLKAAASVVQVRVGGEPRYKVIPEATIRARAIYAKLLESASDEIVALLERRAAEVLADYPGPQEEAP